MLVFANIPKSTALPSARHIASSWKRQALVAIHSSPSPCSHQGAWPQRLLIMHKDAVTSSRVAGGFSPPAPATPRMRVRTGGRFPQDRKVLHQMGASKAGYDTLRHDRFTRSGAIRSLRNARLTLCRRFRPSPCPTHYGGRLTTMLSSDFCPITPGVTTRRAVSVTVGSGGCSSAFALALRLAPVATTAPLGFDGASSPFGLALSSTSHRDTDRR